MRLFAASISVVLLTATAFAQSDRGTITGTVADPAAAVVPGAKVVATNTANGALSQTVTTGTGNYTLTALPAGIYEVSVEASGFKKATQPRVQVQVAQTARVDFALQVGAATESITVSEEAPLLRTENAEQSINVSGNRINALPLNFGGGGGSVGGIRNWLGFIILSPGVSGTNYNSPVNGLPANNFKIYLEGQDVTSANDTSWTSTVASASVETIGEFSLQTSNFSAEFGQALGAVFNFTTKSGTNQLHGSAYEYFTNEALDARRPFTGARPVSRKHDYGFTVGGPVVLPKLYNGRNKTFFFFNLERFRNKTRAAGTFSTLPTLAYRNGDFSAALTGRRLGTDVAGQPIMENAIYDPRSDSTVAGSVVRTPFDRNVIPSSLLDPVARKIQALIPNPDNAEVLLNWQPNTANYRFQSIPATKIDHNFNDNTKLSGYWSVQNTDEIAAADGLPIPITSRRDKKVYGHIARVNLDRTIRPTLLFHLGAGYVRFNNPDSSPPSVLQYDAVKEFGLSGSATNPSGMPVLRELGVGNRGGIQNLGPSTANNQFSDKLTGVANTTYIRNNHTYKLGAEFRQDVWTEYNYDGAQGQYVFGNGQTALPYLQTTSVGGGSIGAGYASFLMGLVSNANVNAVKDPQWRKKSWGLYIQDTWKITRRMTLDYGLRWDYSPMGHEIHYRSSQLGVNTPNPAAGNLPGGYTYEGYGPGRCNCEFVNTYPYAVGPRLGLAYQINAKTVLRAGWGIIYSAGPNWAYVTGGSPALGVGYNSITWVRGFGQAVSRFQDGLKYNIADLYVATLDPGVRPSPGQLDVPPAWGPQMKDPNGGRPARVNQWNLAVQRELTKDMSLEVAYVGNRGIWEEARGLINLNAINPAALQARNLDLRNAADRQLLTSRIDSPLAASRGFTRPYAGFPGFGTVAQTLRPFPMYNDNLPVWWSPLGNNWYDSLQVKFSKRYSHGLDMTAAFTWQKELATTGGVNDVFNRGNQKALTGASQPLIFVTGFNYQTPRPGTNRLIRRLAGDWTVGGVLRYASGSLIGVPASRNNLGTLTLQASGTRFNRVPGQPLFQKDPNCHCIDPNKDFVLNPAAWSDAAAGEWGFGPAFYNDYRWRRNVSEQLSIGRSFPIRERMSFQIRAEFFNAFNRMQTPNPASGNPLQSQTFDSRNIPNGGFGYINAVSTGGQRNGQLVARFQW